MAGKRDKQASREFWATHTIDETPGEEVEVAVKSPLSAMLSLRLDPEDLEQLRGLANSRKQGLTTTARMLLRQSLQQPVFPKSRVALERLVQQLPNAEVENARRYLEFLLFESNASGSPKPRVRRIAEQPDL